MSLGHTWCRFFHQRYHDLIDRERTARCETTTVKCRRRRCWRIVTITHAIAPEPRYEVIRRAHGAFRP